VRILECESKLQWLLGPLVDDFFPKLAFVANAVELALDVLLRDLQKSQNRMVRLLTHEVQDAPELLRRGLTPALLHTRSEILRAILPIKELHVYVELFLRAIAHPGSREDAHDLAQFHGPSCQLRHVILER
jgi:hypothetical protein